MRVLVTGAAGFIGSHACEKLLSRGDQVVGLDNLNDHYDPKRKLANVAAIERSTSQQGAFEFVQGDVRDRQLLNSLLLDPPVGSPAFDAVVHLAAMAGVRASLDNPWLYQEVNLGGTLNLLEALRHMEVPANLVLASTSSVYGNTAIRPFVETDPCDRPLAPYGASKRAAEMLAFTYHHLYQLDVTALRFFTVYGPRGRPDMMAYKVLASTLGGPTVPYYENGQMHRDWTYVDDIVQGITAAADRRLGYECINLGRGRPVLVSEFVQLLTERCGRQPALAPQPMPGADVAYTFADTSKAERLLEYRPQVGVREGVDRLCHWFDETHTPSFSG